MDNEEVCLCGHDKACHVDLINTLKLTLKNNKESIVWIDCMIDGCKCDKYIPL